MIFRNGLNVVMDGMGLLFAINEELTKRSQGAPFCYQAIRDELFKFFDYMRAKNLILKCVVTDTLPDEFKLKEYASRCLSREEELETFWKNNCSSYRSCLVLIYLNHSS